MMKLQFLGATDTVTGSKYLVRAGKSCVLVDCGLFQGYKSLRLRNWSELPLHAGALDAIVLTHAHIDHSGYLPLLWRQGYRGRVFCSPATADLCRILLPDAGHLQEEEAEFANRHGFSRHAPALPLYTRDDALRSLKLLKPVEFEREFSPAPGLTARLHRAGHLPGAAFVRFDDGSRSLMFSGDLGRPHDLLMPAPAPSEGADFLVVESTYGDRTHPASDPLDDLAAVINRTAARGGIVLIPAFAVGRAQTLMWALHQLKQRRAIHHLPVYLNSPMAAQATQVYLRHCAGQRLSAAELEAMAQAAHMVESVDESRALNLRKGPMVVIAASGMATGGRVVHHLKAWATDARNTILLAGFQAGGTRGATLLGGARTIRIHGEDVPVRAEVAQLENMSAHADAAEIIEWLRGFKQVPRGTFITHGEPAAADAMRQRIERELRWSARVPYYLETVTLR